MPSSTPLTPLDPVAIQTVVQDPRRLAAVRGTRLLDAEADPAYLRLAQVAARIMRAPAVLVTLVDGERDFVLGGIGLPQPVLDTREIRMAPTFCQYSVALREPYTIDDARLHPEFAQYPAVLHLGAVACANVPLISAEGHAIGNFCVVDLVPRSWSDDDRELLSTLAAAAVAELELRKALRTREDVLQRVPDAVLTVDHDWRLTFVNQKAESLLARDSAALIGCGLWDVFPLDACEAFEAGCRVARVEGRPTAFEAQVESGGSAGTGGDRRWFDVHAEPSETGLSIYFRDITARKAVEAQLSFQALHDPLTGLANRVLLLDRLEHGLERRQRADRSGLAVALLDIDDFKRINDTLGHAAGDQLLAEIAGRLRRAVRGYDTVARFGGDEFAVLIDGSSGHDEALAVVDRILPALRRPLLIEGQEIRLQASIGVVHAAIGDSAHDLLRNADVAMYRAKEAGKGRRVVFEPAMYADVVERRELEFELRAAVADPAAFGLRLVYQPLVQLSDNRLIGTEALIRWQHASRGPISPAVLIPLAEETGLIVPLGLWVLRTACAEFAAWRARWAEAGLPAASVPGVSVNVSGVQLQQPGFVADVARVLAECAVPPERITLEITESVIMQDTEQTIATLHALKALGVMLAIDDFGTGYSSLAYLRRFPVDVLKIDKSFIDGVAGGASDAALARTIIALGDTLNLRTVAEGIEDSHQRSELRELGCAVGQGYLFSRPLEVEALLTLLASDAVLPARELAAAV